MNGKLLMLGTAAWLLGCAHLRPVETIVRRVDSLAGISNLGRELGPEGWHMVSVSTQRDGWSYVVVLQRETPRW